MNPILAIAFDCFGTVFDMDGFPGTEIAAYVEHVNQPVWSRYRFGDAWYQLKAHPDSAEGIKQLQIAGYKCVALSNGSRSLIEHISSEAHICWNQIIDLADHQTYKPKRKAYRVAALEIGVAPANTMMVTANATFGDLGGAAAVGMQSYLIRDDDLPTIVELANRLDEFDRA